MTINNSEYILPEFENLSDDYLSFSISIFDHILSEDEARNSNIMFYQLALENEVISEYLDGEHKFSKLYSYIMPYEVYSFSEETNSHIIVKEVSELQKIIINSLRELKLMDIYIPSIDLRIFGGYDRTDILSSANKETISIFKKIAQECGLFII